MPFNDENDNLVAIDYYDTIECDDYFKFNPKEYIKDRRNLLNVLHMNIRSMRKNFDQFLLYMGNGEIEHDVIVLTETWIEHDYEFDFCLDQYEVLKRNSVYTKSDGLCIFIKKKIFNFA